MLVDLLGRSRVQLTHPMHAHRQPRSYYPATSAAGAGDDELFTCAVGAKPAPDPARGLPSAAVSEAASRHWNNTRPITPSSGLPVIVAVIDRETTAASGERTGN